MTRLLRIERAGGWYHLTTRGNERRPIYRDARDCRHFCELLAELVPRFHLRLHCFVGLGKSDQQRVRAGVSPAPESARVGERIAALRRHHWNSEGRGA